MSKKEITTTNTELEEKHDEELVMYFQAEETDLTNAVKEIDDLYSEVKIHYDEIKKATRSATGGRGLLTFIEKQTSNLVSLKNAKATLINSRVTLKKYEAELALKQKKDQNDNQLNNEIVNAVLEKLEKETDEIVIDEIDFEEVATSDNADDLLEKRIAALQKEGKIKIEEPEYDGDDEGINLAIYVDGKKWKFIGINEVGKIVKGFPVPDKKGFKMKLHKEEDGSYIAYDQDDKIYQVIKAKIKKKKK